MAPPAGPDARSSDRLSVLDRLPIPLVLIAAVVLCILSLSTPALLLVDAAYDIYIPLDAGLRWIDGFRPSIDYPSPIGPLYAALHGTVLRFDLTDARSIIRVDAVMLGLEYLLLWPMLRGLPKLSRAVILLLMAAMMMTPLALDSFSGSYRYVADYNRWAWGYFAVGLIWSCNPQARGRQVEIALGIALCLLLVLKLPMFCGTIACCGLGWLRGRSLSDVLIPAVMIVLAAGIGYLAGWLLPYVRDNIDIAKASDTVRIGKGILQLFSPYNAVSNILAMILCVAPGIAWRPRILFGSLFVLLHLVGLQNHDIMVPLIGLPLLLLGPDLIAPEGRWLRPGLASLPVLLQGPGLYLVAILALLTGPQVARSFNAQPLAGAGTLGERIQMSTQPGWTVVGAGDLPYTDEMIFRSIKAAQALLPSLPVGSRIATLEQANIALSLAPAYRSAPYGPLWYHYRRGFSDEIHTPPARAFAGADGILVPSHFTTDSTRRLVGYYQPWLDRCATVIAENELWRIYRPKGAAAGSGGVADDCVLIEKP
jgi:hypothetical protein